MFFCYKGIYECKLVNSPPVGPYGFIHPAKILLTHRGLYMDHFEKTWLQGNIGQMFSIIFKFYCL